MRATVCLTPGQIFLNPSPKGLFILTAGLILLEDPISTCPPLDSGGGKPSLRPIHLTVVLTLSSSDGHRGVLGETLMAPGLSLLVSSRFLGTQARYGLAPS